MRQEAASAYRVGLSSPNQVVRPDRVVRIQLMNSTLPVRHSLRCRVLDQKTVYIVVYRMFHEFVAGLTAKRLKIGD